MAERRAKTGPGERVASARAGKIQAFEWIDGAVQRKAGIAAGGGEPGFARGERCEPRGSPWACEHDGTDAAAVNDDAFGAADCGSRRGPGRHAEFGRGDRHDWDIDARAFAEFSRCAGIARRRCAASELYGGGD